MSAEMAVSAAVLAALRGAPGLATLHRIGSGEGERGQVPHAWINEVSGTDWGSKDRAGRDVRLFLSIADRGEAARLAGLCAAAEAALLALPRPLDGWDHAGGRITRVRASQRRDGTRVAGIELRLRLMAPA